MSNVIHPARTRAFDDLLAGLTAAKEKGAVHRRYDKDTGLTLWVYTQTCVFDDLWDEFSMMARGLILHEGTKQVVATPFPKFFNAGERHGSIPDGPFTTYEKVDGSLIILFHWDGKWRCATKGAFDSDQAKWAQASIERDGVGSLYPGWTYLAEAVYPENVIVVHYDEPGLVMLGAYAENGQEVGWDQVYEDAVKVEWRAAETHYFESFADLFAKAKTLPATEEGFVIRFEDGLRLKVKGDEYKRIHALISRITPIAMWEAILAGDDMAAIKRDIPEEFWSDYDAIVGIIQANADALQAKVDAAVASVAHLEDRELGLSLSTISEDVRGFLFPVRKYGAESVREKVLKAVRPTGDMLAGYVPSYAIRHATEYA